MAGNREDWFPTCVWYFDWDGTAQYGQPMIDALYAMREDDSVGITTRSTKLGWHSQDDLQDRKAFLPLMDAILANCHEIAEFEQWNLDTQQIIIMNSWGIINQKYAYNTCHNHPYSLISGVYYLQTPENCGNLEFRDPREPRLMRSFDTKGHNPWTFHSVVYRPVEGRMVLFPSWLLHSVHPNMSDEDRICISFNLNVKRRETAAP